jgi:hypothetical protein
MVHTDNDSKRVGEMQGAMEAARLFVLDALETCRFVFEKGLTSAYEATREELKFLFKRFTMLDYVFGNLSMLGLLLSFTVFLSGFGLLGYQIVVWLQDGVWNAMPLMIVFTFLFEGTAFGDWMQNPEAWVGLHQVMEWLLVNTPISLVLIVDGLVLSAGMVATIVFAVMVRRFQFKHRE